MKTIINHTLYFSRENAHPFLVISTLIYNKAGKAVHSHSATLSGEHEWERRELWNCWQAFKAEKADLETMLCSTCEAFKYTAITKTWED